MMPEAGIRIDPGNRRSQTRNLRIARAFDRTRPDPLQKDRQPLYAMVAPTGHIAPGEIIGDTFRLCQIHPSRR